jgi:hypothetical protein
MTREDLTFATCYQLAQLISEDWENQPSEVKHAIYLLKPIDEPGELFWGVPPIVNPLKLAASEREPDSIRLNRKLYELEVVSKCFKLIIEHSDQWQTQNSDDLKKEIISRVKEYEEEIISISKPVPFTCHIQI